jgi:serine/threonine protein kinase
MRNFLPTNVDLGVGMIRESDLQDEFEFHGMLGAGVYGEARMVVRKRDGKKFAIKTVFPSPSDKLDRAEWIVRLLREFKFQQQAATEGLSKGGADFFVRVFEARLMWRKGEDKDPGIVMLMELMAHDLNAAPTMKPARLWLHQISKALQILHSRKLVHRDAHSGNIMIDFAGNAKLADFGFSCLKDACAGPVAFGIGNSQEWQAPAIPEYDIWLLLRSFAILIKKAIDEKGETCLHDLWMTVFRMEKEMSHFVPEKTLGRFEAERMPTIVPKRYSAADLVRIFSPQ